jgi:glycosyltransferase involved in cell wall biosynthesis
MPAAEARHPRVSVVVPVRNGGADLRELLRCLDSQSLPREEFEVVVGDDGSTDGSGDELQTDDGFVRVVPGPPLNSYAARNRAAAAAQGEVLAFCDADCRPEPDWLRAGLSALDSADVVAGRIRFTRPEPYTAWTLLDMELSKDQERHVRGGVAETANLFVHRALFEQLRGFDATIAEGGDYDFVERAVAQGARLAYAAEAVVWHPARTTGASMLRALWIYGCGYGERVAQAGGRPYGMRPSGWVPLVRTLRHRRRTGRPLGLDRAWLQESGVEPTVPETVSALCLLYVVEPYLRNVAHARGWWRGRGRRPLERVTVD